MRVSACTCSVHVRPGRKLTAPWYSSERLSPITPIRTSQRSL
jgi:hypothetical protein